MLQETHLSIPLSLYLSTSTASTMGEPLCCLRGEDHPALNDRHPCDIHDSAKYVTILWLNPPTSSDDEWMVVDGG